jgi:GrpB-like predicted nucleotidyltransferase (UPF0157 family)
VTAPDPYRDHGLEPTTEEEIRAARVGGPPSPGRVVLVDYDPGWPAAFARESERVRAALGEEALAVEHVGSTSVPGLAAKNVIDILVVVPDSADEPVYVPPLEAAGYPLHIRERGWYEHRMLRGRDPRVNLHVFSHGCPEIERMLRFRDWLRAHREDRDRYERTKRALAAREWKYTQHYADAKTEVVEAILAKARAGD